MKLTVKKKADMLLFVTATGWALSTILIKLYIETVPVFHLMFGRYFIAFIFIAMFQSKKLKTITKADIKPSFLLGVLTFIAFTLAIMSLSYTSASKSGFLVAMSVLFVPIVTTFKNKKLPGKWTVLSVFLSIIGLYFISGMNGGAFNKGDLLALLCAAAYTVYIMLLDKHAKHIDESKLVLIQLAVVSMISLVCMVVFEGIQVEAFVSGFMPILIIAILGTAITNFAQTKAQQNASPESVGLILLGEPLFTLIMAATLLKESILLPGLFGAGLLLTALVLTVIKNI